MKWLQGELGEEAGILPPPKAVKIGPTPNKKYDDNEPYCQPPDIGDVVAVPFNDNDTNKANFWLGKCLRVNSEDCTVLLGWFQEISKNKYKMKIGASWPEVCVVF